MDQDITAIIPKIKNDYGKKECASLTRLLASHSVDIAIIKGPFLNEICQTQKISHDLDILVAEKDLQTAWDILTQHYDPYRDSQIYIEYCHNNDCQSLGVNHLAVLNPKNNASILAHPVELHFAIAPCYYSDFGEDAYKYNLKDFDAFSYISTMEFQNEQVYIPNPTLQFWILLLHYSSHFVTGLRNSLLKGTPIYHFNNLLSQISKYWTIKSNEIDINTIVEWSHKWKRCIQTYLPIKLLNDLYYTQIPLSLNMQTLNSELKDMVGVDLVRKALPEIVGLSSSYWETDNIFPAFSHVLKSKMRSVRTKHYFHIRELIGLRYHQHETAHRAYGRVTISNDDPDSLFFVFSGIRTNVCTMDFQEQQQFELERGTPGLYLTFFEFSDRQIQKTYLCPFDQSGCDGTFLLYADQAKQYEKKAPCSYQIERLNQDEIEISLTISAHTFGINTKDEIKFSASVGSFEPYFHMIDSFFSVKL